MKANLCDSCPKKDSCSEICEPVALRLNGPYEGKFHREIRGGVDFEGIRVPRGSPEGIDGDEKARNNGQGIFGNIKLIEPFDAVELYKPCWDLLSFKQQEAVQLYHGEHKGLKEIATLLGISPSSVHGRLKRAREIKDRHSQEMRRSELSLLRECETNWRE